MQDAVRRSQLPPAAVGVGCSVLGYGHAPPSPVSIASFPPSPRSSFDASPPLVRSPPLGTPPRTAVGEGSAVAWPSWSPERPVAAPPLAAPAASAVSSLNMWQLQLPQAVGASGAPALVSASAVPYDEGSLTWR